MNQYISYGEIWEIYWVERWKLKRKVVDNTFQFEEFESEEKADLEDY